MRKWKIAALALLAVPAAALAQAGGDPSGDWKGVAKMGALDIKVALHLGATSTFDSPDQGAKGLPATLSREGEHVVVTIPNVGVFKGLLKDGGKTLAGTLSAGPQSTEVVFERGTFAAAARPQTPTRPYPYREVEASYDNKARPGVRLAGTLTVPQGKGPFPTALLITGSGRQDRDETLFEHKPFLVLADYLTRRGIAVLRVDDRGVGGSTGATPNDTSMDYATDVQAGIDWLKTRPEVDAKRIGLIGHSEGGLIAPIVAKGNRDVAFAVLWAGTGVSGADVIVEQVRAVTASSGATAEAADAAAKQQRALVDSILTAKDEAAAYQAALKIATSDGTPQAQAEPSVKFLTGPWFRTFLTYDPGPTLTALDIPVLALLGGKDVQVLATQNGPAMERALANNKKAKVITLPNLNHLFQNANSGSPSEYGQITETVDPAALKLMGDWVAEVTGAGHGAGH